MIGYWIDIFILILMVKTKSNPRSFPKLCEGVGINMSRVPQEAQFQKGFANEKKKKKCKTISGYLVASL